MHLYNTSLIIENSSVPYIVTKEGELTLFKPDYTKEYSFPAPIFWVAKKDGG
ncbi:MAG: hypothetical protein JWQ09_317 [Segetibacter sp.]|nr:hypothetical protein [Segetibacter sp.]